MPNSAKSATHKGDDSVAFVASHNTRLHSLDALRGFDMLWLLGADALFAALFALSGWPIFAALNQQMQHSDWHGLTFYDLIFPLFIFISGVALGLNAGKLKSQNQIDVYRKAFKRALILIILGVFYNHGWGRGIPTDWQHIRYASVLSRIAIAGLLATLVIYHFSFRQAWRGALLVFIAYCIAQACFPLNETASLNAFFDQRFLPGTTYHNRAFDPEGFYGDIGAVFNALAGAWIGQHWFHITTPQKRSVALLKFALMTGSVALALHFIYPINKSLWTGSFVLATIACSAVLLALFHFIFDQSWLPHLRRFFCVIGVNAILAYLGTSLFHWSFTIKTTVAPWLALLPNAWHSVLTLVLLIALQWLVLYWLDKHRAHLKI